MLAILICASIVLTGVATARPRWDGPVAWILGAVLAVLAALAQGGVDHEEYLAIIDLTRSLVDEDVGLQLIAAKDPLFLLFIRVAGVVSDDTQWVFALVAVASVASKISATRLLPRRRTLFTALYGVFLAPGLEFAAIRAGLAIGLIMLAYATVSRRRLLWLLLGVSSHFSVLVVWAGRTFKTHRRAVVLALAVAAPVVALPLIAAARESARFFQYFENPGTAFSLLLPLATLLPMVLLARSSRRFGAHRGPLLSPEALSPSYYCVWISILLALPVVTVSLRILEIAWVMITLQIVAASGLATLRRYYLYLVGAGTSMLLILSIANVLRGTWQVLIGSGD